MTKLTKSIFPLLFILLCTTIQVDVHAEAQANPNNTVNISAFPSLSAAISSPKTNGKTIIVNTFIKVNDLTIPSTKGLKIVKGGGFILDEGKTLTIQGPFKAGLFPYFEAREESPG